MAVDSANKRRSLLGLRPIPDGDLVNAPDRRQLAGLYRGPNAPPPSGGALVTQSLGEVRTDVLYRLGDSVSAIWSQAEIESYVRQGYGELVGQTGALWIKDSPAGLDDVANQATYTLPTDLLVTERLTWKQKKIEPLDPDWLRMKDAQFQTRTGDVIGYTIEGDGLRTLRKIRIPPITETGNISIEYQRRGTPLTGADNQFDIPNLYVKYIRHFAMGQALRREGPGQDLKLAKHYEDRFKIGILRMLKRKQSVVAFRVSRFGGEGLTRTGPPRPRLPWQYGQVVP